MTSEPSPSVQKRITDAAEVPETDATRGSPHARVRNGREDVDGQEFKRGPPRISPVWAFAHNRRIM